MKEDAKKGKGRREKGNETYPVELPTCKLVE